MAKKQSTKNVFSILLNVVQLVLIVLLVIVAVASFGSRVPLLAQNGLSFFAVTSGSMEPTIPVGSVIRVGKYKLEDLKKGDIVTYQFVQEDGSKPVVVTHRVDEVTKTEEQKEVQEGVEPETYVTYAIRTKGDANNDRDSYVLGPNNIIGVYKGHLPYLGFVSTFVQTSLGFISLVIIPALILIVWETVTLVLHFKNKSDSAKEKEIAELKAQLKEKTHE